MFLDRLDRLDLDDPVEERERLIENLASMPLVDEDIQRARDVCVEAHRAILEAEALHVRARDAVAEYPDEAEIPITKRARIERDLRSSNEAIQRSRPLFERCHTARGRLDRRYRARR